MKGLLIILLFLIAEAQVAADKINIIQVRALYKKSATDQKACKELSALLSSVDGKRPLLLGYKASNTMMMAKYALNPLSKLAYFKKGKEMLGQAVELDNKNIELRLLRFVNQANSPSFLGYKDRIETDKKFILTHISNLKEPRARAFVTTVLKESKYLNADEKRRIK